MAGIKYGAAKDGSQSTMSPQLQTFFFQKQALIDIKKDQYFSQLADTTSMPKNMGKKIVRYHYLPLLDDANINDQGIDAAGQVVNNSTWYVTLPSSSLTVANANKAAVAAAINDNTGGVTAAAGADNSAGAGFATVTVTGPAGAFGWVGSVAGANGVAPFPVASVTKANTIFNLNVGATIAQGSGNLYGSSKDIGTIAGKLPVLSENGGRVNRVGFKRKQLEGTFEKFGFFDEYTQESMDFDSDADLEQHINREMINGANEMTEDALQIDLLNSAGVVRFAGSAVAKNQIDKNCIVSYSDIMHLGIDLDNNRTPKQTTVITGTRLIDTKVIAAARVAYCGSELLPTLKAMKDLHGNQAFIEVQKYAAGGSTVTGEVGSVDQMRFVVVPEMQKWSGAGADASADATCYETAQRYDVFPILCVGDQSFTTIGFQTDGKTVKFTVYHKKPGEATADRNDPYGETGFMSIKWYYGFMVLRPERIGLILTAAKL